MKVCVESECNDECLDNGFDAVSQILTNQSSYSNQAIIDEAMDLFVPILQSMDVDAMNVSAQNIQNVIRTTSEQSVTTDQAQTILCLNSLLVLSIFDNPNYEICEFG